MITKKILVLDGISGISLGLEIADTFSDLQINTNYVSSKELVHRNFYKINSAIKKIIHRHLYKEDYYRYPKISNKSIQATITNTKPDVIFVIGFMYRFFDLKFISQLKQEHSFKLFLYDTDSCNLFSNKRELIFFIEKELPVYDHIYSFSKTTTGFINKLSNLNATHLAFGAKKIIIRADKKINDILFVGSTDMRRIYLLEYLSKFKLSVFGSKWKRNKAVISPELYAAISPVSIWGEELYQHIFSSKIILNITRSGFYGVETGINLRIFETLAAQGFLLTDYTPELGEIFKIGEEIESYSCSEELIDKVDYYLKNEAKRNKIAKQGHQLYLEKYTWESRIRELIEDLSL